MKPHSLPVPRLVAAPPRRLASFCFMALACLAGAAAAAAPGAQEIPTQQQQYHLARTGKQGYKLEVVDAPVRAPGAHEVLVRVRAVSLNRRDVLVMKGQYPIAPRDSLVPLSDGAGEIAAIGPGVTRFHVGDRVAAIFFQSWLSGRQPANVAASALGGDVDGMLTHYATLSEQGVVALPKNLSFEEGATLPCAAVTAWNGLVTRGRMQPGDFVLLEGTGGVSMFGLQFATLMGAKPIITSSSDAKLERAKQLGAFGTINYKTTPDWDKSVLALTGNLGVHEILEVGGKDTLALALASVAPGGHVALIGGLGGFGGDVPALSLMARNVSVSGIYVGSRENFEAMNAFIAKTHFKPVIDKVFEFKDAQAAYDLMESDQFSGKIVIRL
ncbi:MAG TPA: NAD(P)-dependent alcohol dehydrogenase [Steroidobacteraceae bacterium]